MQTKQPPSMTLQVCTNMSCYVHLHMSLSSSAAPVADIETYSGMCGRCEEAAWRKIKSITEVELNKVGTGVCVRLEVVHNFVDHKGGFMCICITVTHQSPEWTGQ